MNRAFATGSQLPAGTLQEWEHVVNEHPLPSTEPELIKFVRESNARTARGRPGR